MGVEGLETRHKLTPFLKWAGGKRWLLPHVKNLLPDKAERYVEPFVGGGVIYLALEPERAILGDSNGELMNCYVAVRDHVDELIEALNGYSLHVLDEEYYYSIRNGDTVAADCVAQAARLIFLNKTCYNGLYRVNREGRFNVPFGKYERPPRLYDEANLRGVSELLKKAQLVTGDFSSTVLLASAGDFIYLDPPYHHLANSGSFTSYSSNGFKERDHIRLARTFKALDRQGCSILLTNSDTELVQELYKDYVIERVITNRTINCKGRQRGDFRVLLISNYGLRYRQRGLSV